MAQTKKGPKVGDVIDVKDAEFIVTPDGHAATVRSGGTYRFAVQGKHQLVTGNKRRTYDVEK